MNAARSRMTNGSMNFPAQFLAILLALPFGCLSSSAALAASKIQGTTVDSESGRAATVVAASASISEEEAKEIALKAVPGQVIGVEIEKKFGAKRFVVEIIATADGAETDVIIEMETGKVLAIEK